MLMSTDLTVLYVTGRALEIGCNTGPAYLAGDFESAAPRFRYPFLPSALPRWAAEPAVNRPARRSHFVDCLMLYGFYHTGASVVTV